MIGVLFLAVVSTRNVIGTQVPPVVPPVPSVLCQRSNFTGQTLKTVDIQDNKNSFQFGVRTCSDAYVHLMQKDPNNDPNPNKGANKDGFEIIIGGCNNTMSAIMTMPDQPVNTVSFNNSVGPLNCDEMKFFCIDLEQNDVIKVGYGLGVYFNEFLRLNVPKPSHINYANISTWNNISEDSVFNKSLSSGCTVTSVAESTTTPIGGTSATDTQTPAQTTGYTMTSVAENTTTPIGGTSATDTQTPAQTTGNTMTSEASAPTVTTGIQQSTPTIETTETILPNNSSCKCPCRLQHNQTEEERATYLRTAIEQIRKELKMEKKNLSSETRKKTSARDERVSAKTMGFTLGVCVLTTVFGSIIIVDLVKLGRFIWKKFI